MRFENHSAFYILYSIIVLGKYLFPLAKICLDKRRIITAGRYRWDVEPGQSVWLDAWRAGWVAGCARVAEEV